MDSPKTFPREVLDWPTKERLSYFKAHTVGHPFLNEAYQEVRWAIHDSTPGKIITLYGPPGAGKSTLLQRVENEIKKEMLAELEEDRERIPVVLIQLESPDSGIFKWKPYYKELLFMLEEPLVNNKIDISQWEPNRHRNLRLLANARTEASAYRDAVKQTLLHRKPVAILVDDAQHFGVIGSGRRLVDQTNTIKSLADKTHTTHVLGGTYELLELRNLNGQLSRRSVDIHFQRYDAKIFEHREAFINVVWDFERFLPVFETPNLRNIWDYLYEGSLGCVGLLKDWLSNTLALSIREGFKTITMELLERRALSMGRRNKIWTEITEGEMKLREDESFQHKLRNELGLDEEPVTQSESQLAAQIEQPKQESPKKPGGRRGRRPGTRNATRDKAGRKVA